MATIDARNLDVNKVTFTVAPAKPGRNPTINMKYDGSNFQIKFPRMSTRLMTREGDDGKTSYTLSMALGGCDNYGREPGGNTDNGKVYDMLRSLEKKVLEAATEGNSKWFGKKRSDVLIQESFKNMLRLSSDKIDGEYVPNGKYPPSFYIKVPVYDGKVSLDSDGLIDGKGNPIYVTPHTLSTVFPNNVEVAAAVTGSIYVMAGGGFGLTWRLKMARVYPQTRVSAASIFKDEEEEEQTEETQQQETEVTNDENQRPSTPVDQQIPVATPAAPRKRRSAAQ